MSKWCVSSACTCPCHGHAHPYECQSCSQAELRAKEEEAIPAEKRSPEFNAFLRVKAHSPSLHTDMLFIRNIARDRTRGTQEMRFAFIAEKAQEVLDRYILYEDDTLSKR